MPRREDIQSILIIGSGPIVIGQACEFDYSGTQAVKALKELGYRVLLVNPNPATVMTTPGLADKIYMEPLTVEYVESILREERPDALLSTMGGQTALNLALELDEAGVLEKYGVEIIGAEIQSIKVAEDREAFKELVTSIGLESPRSSVARSVEGALRIADKISFPVVIRPSYTLGGMGGAIAHSAEELEHLAERALRESPTHEALIEESLIGWKEFEMEVMRDRRDNAIIVCSIENIDPMGVHTGDSITIAPIQTLSDREYQKMRTASIDILRAVGVDCGGSNVQFAMKPGTDRMVVIEMNPRVSRSSALASKATGFPIARASALLSVGFTLDEIQNEITGKTVACFEPALDYCAVKIPRFETEKFPVVSGVLGTQMKSVGEALALGRTALEALNKAFRSVEIGLEGLQELPDGEEELQHKLTTAHPQRMLAAYTVIRRRGKQALAELARITGYDPWFLHQLWKQHCLMEDLRIAGREGLMATDSSEGVSREMLLEAKRTGLSDSQIAEALAVTEDQVSAARRAVSIAPSYHFVDTCAGEFEANTPYFYSTWGEEDEGEPLGEKGVIILASGPNRIGQGLEFDTGCTLTSLAYREAGRKPVMINSNPETVSTDYNVSDRLYMEPLTTESVFAVVEKEKVKDVVVQLGGQTPLNLAEELEEAGCRIVGTPVQSILDTEDRGLFSALMNKLGLQQPANRMAGSRDEVFSAAEEIGYPLLLRPSFVLGGRSMEIAYTREGLERFLGRGIVISPERPVLVDQFLEDAFEYDLDALCDGHNVYIGGIMQHIEAAGIHSGDSACVFPAYKSRPDILEAMRVATVKIAREIGVKGFLNIQYAAKGDQLYIIEVNPRASRTVPYLSKSSGVNLIKAAVKIWEGTDLVQQGLVDPASGVGEGTCRVGWSVKEAVFSFDRFADLDPMLGPEMKSTGEVIGTGDSFGEAFAKAQAAAGIRLPTSGIAFVSVHRDDKETILPIVQDLVKMGFTIAATRGTANYLFEKGIFPEVILKIQEGRPHVVDHMRSGRISLVINTPRGRFSQTGDNHIRSEAVRLKIPYTTTTSAARAAVEGIRFLKRKEIHTRALPEYEGY